MIKMYVALQVKYPLFLAYFNETWILPMYFRNILKYQVSLNFSQREPSFPRGRVDRQTDKQYEANSRFSQFCESA
jgi:hypothetical protein